MSQVATLVSRVVKDAEREVQAEAVNASRRAVGFACLAFSLGLACVFGSAALFLALREPLGGAGAALSVGGLWLFVGIAVACALLTIPRPSKPSDVLPSRASMVEAIEQDARALSPWLSIAAGVGAGLASAARGRRDEG